MKFNAFFKVAVGAGVIAGATSAIFLLADNASVNATTLPEAPSVPIYRLYNPVNGEHLYTEDANEKDVLSTSRGWTYEGTGWQAPSTGTPVYRLYNPTLKNHLYTTDTNEVKTLTKGNGWQSDNNGNPLFYSGGSVSIYRLYNKGLAGMHLLSTDTNEYNTLPKYGWSQEGTKLYGVEKGTSVAPAPITSSSTLGSSSSSGAQGSKAVEYTASDGVTTSFPAILGDTSPTVYIANKGNSGVFWLNRDKMPSTTIASDVITVTQRQAIAAGKRESLKD
ncbi:MAG: hypothetical protein LBI11_04470 [Streptococcaceae bacterium]|jgi:hypothetical protein|nr:hypothetical protein [Streptococcaceae bacterium]